MKFKMISDTAARVQVKGSVVEKIMQEQDKHHGGHPTTENGCWVTQGGGGWVTLSAFGSDAQAERALLRDLLMLEAHSN